MRQLVDKHVRTDKEPSAILAIWGTWLILVLVLALLNPLPDGSLSLVGDVTVLLHMAVSILILAVVYPRTVAAMLAVSLVLRTALVFWDLNFSNIFGLWHSGADTEMYYGWSLYVADDLSLLSQDIRGGVFSKMFGVLFYAIGPMRVFAQYTNALFGLTIVLLTYKILHELQVGETISTWIVALAAFLPNTLILSAVFLRESVIAVLIAYSLIYFIRWFLRGGPWRIVIAVLFVLSASSFHSGVITVALGYMLVALFYKRDGNHFGFGGQSLPYLAIFAAIFAFTVFEYPDLFLGKFEQFESEEVIRATNYRLGESTYLTNLTVDSYRDLIRFGPLRGFYFLAAPMPWDFRGASDVSAFVLDSLFYLCTLFYVVRNYKTLGNRRALVIALLIIASLAVLVFGTGVNNSGTALRHRYKLLPIFLVLLALVHGSGPYRMLGSRQHRLWSIDSGVRRRPLHVGRSGRGDG